jgi:peptidyl-prolyl cis-trans isomerase SurA
MQDTNETSQTEKEATVDEVVESRVSTPRKTRRSVGHYLVVVGVVLLIGVALLYALERQGRVHTGIFGDVVGGQPVAYVNGSEILRRDYDSSVNQLLEMASTQGADVTNEEIATSLRTQALDTLINGELLRQAALEAGMTATPEAVDARYQQITADVGGEELLAARMAEFGITEEVLRRDIENEILIQGLFEERFPADQIEVSEEEIRSFYDQATAGSEEAPAFEEVSAQIEEQIRRDRQQQEVSNLIDSLREEADIETLL